VNRSPQYNLRATTLADVRELFETHHGYKSVSNLATYCFAVFEDDRPVAAYAWQPPPPGSAKSVCPEAPQGVLSLSRMVAVDRQDRRLKHISKPLRRQMNHMIDRTRWPVLVTYSDEGQGHNGFVYECSGWIPTVKHRALVHENAAGSRSSSYSNGRCGTRNLVHVGSTMIQRWENRICAKGEADAWMKSHGWRQVEIAGKTWKSGRQAHTYIRAAADHSDAIEDFVESTRRVGTPRSSREPEQIRGDGITAPEPVSSTNLETPTEATP
jgi:hypothetical protein